MSDLYREISIWKRVNESMAIKYNCFEIVGLKKFCVQSADYYSFPLNSQDTADLHQQYLELFLEEVPEERSSAYDTLEEAIKNFDDDFK